MGISSAMNAGVMGLNVNSSKLATISDNIANSETKGYKRANIEFNSLVLTERPTAYDAGGVRASTTREIDDQGALLSTRSGTDLAISGRGFLPVTDIADVNRNAKELPLKLLRTGSFRPDQNGVLQTGSGLALLGWPRLGDGSFSTIQTELVPVQVDGLSLSAERTQNMEVKANLDADAETGTVVPMPIEFYDTLGRSQYVELLWTKVAAAPAANATATTPAYAEIENNTWQLEVWTQPYRNEDNVPTRAPSNAFLVTFDDSAGGVPGGIKTVLEYERDRLGPAATVTNGVFQTDGTRTYDWNTDADAADGDPAGVIDALETDLRWDVDPDSTTAGVFTYFPTGDESDPEEALSITLGWEGGDGHMVQYSAESSVLSVSKDGSPASSLIAVEIDQNGLMDAVFESGVRQTLYKIPIANVQNPNGMRALDGQAFALTRESGSVYFYDAGSGPTGALVSSALEESTTDVAEELTQLIKTQRAYSSNAKIIQTVDEMLQETTNLKR